MSAFSGPSWEHGGMAAHKKRKREQAEARNARTPIERTRTYRLLVAATETEEPTA